ncbi:MAG: hypothetical protein IKU01_01735 [Bacteroidales bacterium]|nr:hypothetical protein [Bacteroidales bacterium]
MLAICYKRVEPIVYNEGTKYERREDEFLAYYVGNDRAKAEAEAERLTREKPERWFDGTPAPEVLFYFIEEQEMIC